MTSFVKIRQSVFILLLIWFVAMNVVADDFQDDHGEGMLNATAFGAFGGNASGTITFDVDEDWFSFVAFPGKTYRFVVFAGTIWDTALTLVGPDGETKILAKNSVRQTGALDFNWVNNGAFGTYFAKVSAGLEFTLGSYLIVIEASGMSDGDGDGMDDAWEQQVFGTLSRKANEDYDGDGFSNLEEYYLNSKPTDDSSGLYITEIKDSSGSKRVTCQAYQQAYYRLYVESELEGVQNWQVIATNLHNSGNIETFIDTDTGSHSQRFYKVDLIY